MNFVESSVAATRLFWSTHQLPAMPSGQGTTDIFPVRKSTILTPSEFRSPKDTPSFVWATTSRFPSGDQPGTHMESLFAMTWGGSAPLLSTTKVRPSTENATFLPSGERGGLPLFFGGEG